MTAPVLDRAPSGVLTARRLLLAAVVVAAPALQVTGMLLHPPLGATPAEQLDIIAPSPTTWFATHVVAAAAGALYILAGPVLAGLARARGAAVATAGAVLTVLGGAVLAVGFGAEAHLLSLAVDPSLDRAAMVELAALEASAPAMTMIAIGVPLLGLGQLLLAGGLLASRAVPRWQPALVLAGYIASIAAAPGSILGPILLVPAVVGYAAIALTLARSNGRTSSVPAS